MNDLSARDIITGGILTGTMIEFSLFLKRGDRYKSVFKYSRAYPGFALATTSCVIGLSWMYGKLALHNMSLLQGFRSKNV